MIGVYILECVNGRYYIGSTKDKENRLAEHNAGKVRSTRHILPIKLVFFQQYSNIIEARRVEYWLKKQKSKELIEKIIKDGKINKTL